MNKQENNKVIKNDYKCKVIYIINAKRKSNEKSIIWFYKYVLTFWRK